MRAVVSCISPSEIAPGCLAVDALQNLHDKDNQSRSDSPADCSRPIYADLGAAQIGIIN